MWGKRQNTLYSGFAKDPRFLNMVMAFVLTPLSHYNSITKPRARFLLSLLKDLSIEFPFHVIISIIDVYWDAMTCDKLIFPSVITRILCHFPSLFMILPTTLSWVPSAQLLFGGARPNFDRSGHEQRQLILWPPPFLPPPLLLLQVVV